MPRLTGNRCGFTWTPGGADNLTEAEGRFTRLRSVRQLFETTPFNSTTGAVFTASGIYYFDGIIEFNVNDDGTPPIPSGTSGTMTFQLVSGSASYQYTGTAFLEQMDFTAQSVGGPPTAVRYSFRFSGTVTVAGGISA